MILDRRGAGQAVPPRLAGKCDGQVRHRAADAKAGRLADADGDEGYRAAENGLATARRAGSASMATPVKFA